MVGVNHLSEVSSGIESSENCMHGSKMLKGKNLIGFLFSIVLSTLAILVSLRIWEVDISLPIAFRGDGVLNQMLVKSIAENGIRGLWFNTRMGAPGISAIIDTPFFDLSMGLEYFILTRFFSNPSVCIYLQYIFSYTLCACTMYLLLNRYTDRVFLKCILSICFAVAPYHFSRGMGHQTLSSYFIIPVFIYLTDVIYCESFHGIIPERYKNHKWKSVVMYISCLIGGMTNIYYFAAGLLCMGFAFVGKIIKVRKKTVLFHESAPIIAVLIGVLIAFLPQIIFSVINGRNVIGGSRGPLEAEYYGLRLFQMLLPTSDNRIGILRKLNALYAENAPIVNENQMASLGLIGTIGFLLSCVWFIGRYFSHNDRKLYTLAKLDIFSFSIIGLYLYATVSGIGSIINSFLTPQLRSLNRFSIVISGLSICVLCLALDSLLKEINRKNAKTICVCGFLLLSGFAFVTETPIQEENWQNSYEETNQELVSFFSEVERTLESDSMVYELPFMRFPEEPSINKMWDYQLGLGYLYTDTIRWSYGEMKGRDHDAELLYIDKGMSYDFIKGLREKGFSGIYIDTSGYKDEGKKIINFYSNEVGIEPVVGMNGQLYFYDISNVKLVNNLL